MLFSDILPAGLAYVPGSLSATAGAGDGGLLPTLTWTGVLTPSPAITITLLVARLATQYNMSEK